MRALIVVLAIGCSSPPASHGTTDDLSSHVSGPTTPGPVVEWTAEGRPTVSLLPAIAHAGEVVVVTRIESDGGRGFPNLAIEVRDRQDKVVQTISILTSNEFEELVPDGKTPAPALTKRIAEANQQLATIHGIHRLEPLVELQMGARQDNESAHMASDSRVDVEWGDHHLRIFPHTRTVPIADRDGSKWLAPDHEPCADCGVCHNESYLAAAYRSEAATLILIRIDFRGTDTCWEPSGQYHVITW
jgi:hypothetical protein